VLASICDLYQYRLARRIFGKSVARWALFAQITNWFNFYCLVRTFSSSVETTFVTVALFYWPGLSKLSCPGKGAGGGGNNKVDNGTTMVVTALLLGALSVAVRPTSAILWLFLGVSLIETEYRRKGLPITAWAVFVLRTVVPCVSAALALGVIADRIGYGEWNVTVLNFLRFNVLDSHSQLYGSHPWHWYFTQGVPTLLGTMLPFAALGLWRRRASHRHTLVWLAFWTLCCYSLIAHKEFRFVLPLLPIGNVYAGVGLATLDNDGDNASESEPRENKGAVSTASVTRTEEATVLRHRKAKQEIGPDVQHTHPAAAVVSSILTAPSKKHRRNSTLAAVFLLATNVPMALYMSLVHQRGPLSAVEYLATRLHETTPIISTVESEELAIHFLMPCHSTPLYSHLHRNVPTWFLDCSPAARLSTEGSESSQWSSNPLAFATAAYNDRELPKFIVVFDDDYYGGSAESSASLQAFFEEERGFVLAASFFHSHVAGDAEADKLLTNNRVLVLERNI
jgi:phosphatidylinositol glycan class B